MTEVPHKDRGFILWDRKDGPAPPRDQNTGEYLTGGCLGELTLDNVYLRSYAHRPDGAKQFSDLEIGECVVGVQYRLSGEKGCYDIYRVR